MLTIKSLTYQIGGRTLYEDLSFQVKQKDRIGLVGLNGSGKSTLFKMIVKELTPISGSIQHDKGTTIGFFNQELLSYETKGSILSVVMEAFDEILLIQRKINNLLEKIESDYSSSLLEELGNLQEQFGQLGGYEMETKAAIMLEKMGFSSDQLSEPFNLLSGGWRMRVLFAKLLLQEPDLLLLDEPTNHLDIVSIQWVEGYLKNYPNAFIVISHDRRFLDATTKKTLEIYNESLHSYSGNYSYYQEEKKRRIVTYQNTYINQQKKIKKTQEFIDRFRAKSSKAKSVQSRVKSLERMDKLDSALERKVKLKFRFKIARPPGKQVVEIKKIEKSFGDIVLFKGGSAEVIRGDKIALIGENGKGKSTLLKLIVGKIPLDGGTITLGHNVLLGFHTQHQLEELNPDYTILETLRSALPEAPESEVRALLGGFLFRDRAVDKKIKVLSGGEKARVSLAKTLALKPNFIILDEPTNHLDIEAIEVLSQALQGYEGTLLLVSHDRDFIQKVATKIWYLEESSIKSYPGVYDEFRVWKSEQEKKQKKTKN